MAGTVVPAKQSQHYNMLHTFGHPVALCCNMLYVVSSGLKMVKFAIQHFGCCTMLYLFGHVRATLHCYCAWACALVWFSISKCRPRYPMCCNILQQGGQTGATCCTQQCCDMLRWNVVCVWPGPSQHDLTMLWFVVLKCCGHLASW